MTLSIELKNLAWAIAEKTERLIKLEFLTRTIFPGFSSAFAQLPIYSRNFLKQNNLSFQFTSAKLQALIIQPFTIALVILQWCTYPDGENKRGTTRGETVIN